MVQRAAGPGGEKIQKQTTKRKQRERTMISGAREDAKSWSARRKPPRTRAGGFHRGSQGTASLSKRKVGNITLSLRLGSHLMQVSKSSLSQHDQHGIVVNNPIFVQDSGGEPAPQLSDGVRYVLPPQHEPGNGTIYYNCPLPSDMGVNEST